MSLPPSFAFPADVRHSRPKQHRHALGLWLALGLAAALPASGQKMQPAEVFSLQEVMIPMRDGAHLQTVILRPAGQSTPLPILFRRTPYGVPASAPTQVPPTLKELVEDGYIFVIQNLRGRFKSEGVFHLSSRVDINDPKAD